MNTSHLKRWLVRIRSKRGLSLRDVSIIARDEAAARDRVSQMYQLSEICTILPSSVEFKGTGPTTTRRH